MISKYIFMSTMSKNMKIKGDEVKAVLLCLEVELSR